MPIFDSFEEVTTFLRENKYAGPHQIEYLENNSDTIQFQITAAPPKPSIYRVTKRYFAGEGYDPFVKVEKTNCIGNPGILLKYVQCEVDVKATDEKDAKYQGLNMIDSYMGDISEMKF